MRHAVVRKDRIKDVLRTLQAGYRLVAPVEEDTLEFREIGNIDEIRLTDEIPYKSPKEFLFPQVERIMGFNDAGEVIGGDRIPKTVVFGVKPCDLEALKILTAVFTKGAFVDTCFVNHLENTIIVGIGCISVKPGCFCAERGLDKGYSRDCDLFLTDQGEYYLAEVLSQKGETLAADLELEAVNFEDGRTVDFDTPDTSDKIDTLELDAEENVLFDRIDWERISEACMGCGMCTYICPTCHCFEFKDVADKGTVSRYRCWDSCMYPKFTLHASGHNPRSSKKERYRQRVLHKYLYIKQNFGYTACTGCGRCIRSCPAGMNIKSVVSRIREELP